jgi:hypothetical protein
MVHGDYLFAALLAGFLYFVIHTTINWPGGHSFPH